MSSSTNPVIDLAIRDHNAFLTLIRPEAANTIHLPFARELLTAAFASESFGAVKRLMAESEPGLEAHLGRESRSIAARGSSAEGREGIAAFLEKRTPRF
jgi:2-(1,2-epoxy-1,2-dihydrophenyl)acetyl-CoA isomerase